MQWSANSLDSSEKMPITGPFAVRAYPTGEASGDRAWLATAELRWTLPQPAQALPISCFRRWRRSRKYSGHLGDTRALWLGCGPKLEQ